jgi:hypothetical protein
MTRLALVAVVVGLFACGKKESGPQAEGSGSASTPSPPPPAPAPDAPPPDAAEPDAAPPPDAAEPDATAAPKLGAPVPLDGALAGLVVQPFDDWSPSQKKDDVSFKNSCCIHAIHLRPVAAKLRNIDDLRAEIGDIQQLLTTQVTEVVEQHVVENGWWAVIKGPSLMIPGDTNTAVLRVVHLKAKTYVCSTLTATGAAGRDVSAEEVVTACGTLRAK